jgi:hypothetical protein
MLLCKQALPLPARFAWPVVLLALLAMPWLIGAAASEIGTPCEPEAACFDAHISLPAVVGDFYLNGELVAAGVNAARLVAAPGEPHLIEVRNMQAPGTPGFGGLFIYPDQSQTQQARAGAVWRLWFYPRQQFIRGTLHYTCLPNGYRAGDSLACRVTIDGVPMPDVSPGGRAAYTLDPGARAVHTELVGDQAFNYSAISRDDVANITAGWNSWLTASFPLKGLFKIFLQPAGLVGDLYVNGEPIASQAAAADLLTMPQVQHVVEVRNVVDPAANGRYRYDDASLAASTFSGGTRWVYLRPQRVWLKGALSFFCQINQKSAADDASCLVKANGADLAVVPAGARVNFDLDIGTYNFEFAVVGASAGRWADPYGAPITIRGGGTAFYTARFNLRPAAPQAAAPVIPAAGAGAAGAFELGGQVDSFSRPDLMKHAGMVWVKRQMRWHPGAWADPGLIHDAHAKGFKVLLSVLGHPADLAGQSNYGDFARYVGELAGHGADAIEVWNEQNIDREWPTGEIDPRLYTELLRQSYIAIKGRNPGTMVISGAPAPTGAEGAFGRARVWNDDSYVAGMAAAGAANYMDCIGAHYNEGIISPTRSSGDPRDGYYTRYYSGMVNTYFNAFGGRRPVCFTELGYLTPEGYGPLHPAFGWAGGTTVAQQAQWLAEAVSLARAGRAVRMIIVFNVDLTHWSDDPQAGYAMIRPGGGCPACDALHNLTGGR